MRKRQPLPRHLGGHAGVTHVDKGALRLFWSIGCRSLIDVGCGPGGQVALASQLGWQAVGLDGDYTLRRAIDCQIIDFTVEKYQSGERFDLAWCCEFVEHVEARYIGNYMPALAGARYLAMTHAPPGKRGHHHVNCQPAAYWKRVMARHGLTYLPNLTRRLRRASSMGREFVRTTGLVFFNGTAA